MFPEVFRLRKPDVDTGEGYQQTVQLLKELEAGMETQRCRLPAVITDEVLSKLNSLLNPRKV